MRLFRKDGGATEWTGIVFNDVRNDIGQGGSVSFSYRDPLMAGIALVKEFMNQRVEVRQNDGTTVLWEGVIDNADYSSLNNKWTVSGMTPLRLTNDVPCGYNGLLASGVVSAIDDDDTPPMITDDTQTFTAAIQDKWLTFTDINSPTEETVYPNSNTDFYQGIQAPTSATGTYEDLDVPGYSGMELKDGNGRATDYYGIDVKWTVPNQSDATEVIITLYLSFNRRDYYAENGSDMPLVEIWDFDDGGGAYVIVDEEGISGLGRRSEGWQAWGGTGNVIETRIITISSNIGRFFDGSNECHVRITMGNSIGQDVVSCFYGKLHNTYSPPFEGPPYEIDIIDGSNLTFTGDSPYADGVRIGDSFCVGDTFDKVLVWIWRGAAIVWADYVMEAVTLIDSSDLRGTMVGTILRRYAEALNWEVWDKIGWDITIDEPAVSTSLSLTEANFISFTFGANGSSATSGVVSGCQNKFIENTPDLKGFPAYRRGIRFNNYFATSSDASLAGINYVTRTEDITHPFSGTIDMDDGTDYSDIELGKLITVTLYTDKHVYTEEIIRSVSYNQVSGGHLYCQIKL